MKITLCRAKHAGQEARPVLLDGKQIGTYGRDSGNRWWWSVQKGDRHLRGRDDSLYRLRCNVRIAASFAKTMQ